MNKTNGFTIFELIVVIGIMGILTSIAYTSYTSSKIYFYLSEPINLIESMKDEKGMCAFGTNSNLELKYGTLTCVNNSASTATPQKKYAGNNGTTYTYIFFKGSKATQRNIPSVLFDGKLSFYFDDNGQPSILSDSRNNPKITKFISKINASYKP